MGQRAETVAISPLLLPPEHAQLQLLIGGRARLCTPSLLSLHPFTLGEISSPNLHAATTQSTF